MFGPGVQINFNIEFNCFKTSSHNTANCYCGQQARQQHDLPSGQYVQNSGGNENHHHQQHFIQENSQRLLEAPPHHHHHHDAALAITEVNSYSTSVVQLPICDSNSSAPAPAQSITSMVTPPAINFHSDPSFADLMFPQHTVPTAARPIHTPPPSKEHSRGIRNWFKRLFRNDPKN